MNLLHRHPLPPPSGEHKNRRAALWWKKKWCVGELEGTCGGRGKEEEKMR